MLEHRQRGRATPDLLGLLKTIAFRRGRDRLRNASADPTDPVEGVLAKVLDRRPTPEEQVMQLLEADTYRQLIDSLGERQRTIMKLRCEWGLSPTEIQDALGISRKAYEKQLTRAFKRVAAGAGDIEDGTWLDRQRELLLACEAGTATAADRERARRLVERSPTCRAMLRRMRGAAALLPLPLALWRRLARVHGILFGRATAAATTAGRGVAATGARAVGGYALAKIALVSAAGLSVVGGVVAELAVHDSVGPTPAPHRSSTRAASPVRRPVRKISVVRRAAPPHVTVTPQPPAVEQPAVPAAPQRVAAQPAVPPPPARPPAPARPTSTSHRPPAGDGSQEFGP